jgi:putative NADH-flavin reductase
MKLTVFGPTGGTGAQLITQALAAGHHVTAMARHPESVTASHPGLTVIKADVLDPASLEGGIHGADAVLSALGTRAMKHPTTVYSHGTAAIIYAMNAAGVTRFVGISASPVAPRSLKSPFERRVLHPLLYRFFGGGYHDMARMEQLLADSPLNWTIFRPPRLTNQPHTGRYRTAVDTRLPGASSISRANLAGAMLAAVANTALYRHAVAIAK